MLALNKVGFMPSIGYKLKIKKIKNAFLFICFVLFFNLKNIYVTHLVTVKKKLKEKYVVSHFDHQRAAVVAKHMGEKTVWKSVHE